MKMKRAAWAFGHGVAAEIQRFRDYMDRADAEWEADPVGASRRFDQTFNRWALRVVGIIAVWAVVDTIIEMYLP